MVQGRLSPLFIWANPKVLPLTFEQFINETTLSKQTLNMSFRKNIFHLHLSLYI
jgi:hypothetical protein